MNLVIAKERPEVMSYIVSAIRNADRVNSQDNLERYHGTYYVRCAMYSIARRVGFTVENLHTLSIAVNSAYISCYDEKRGNMLFAIDRENNEIDYLIY